MTRRYFGTDGIRGTVGEPPITPDFVLKLGWAAGRVLMSRGGEHLENKILIGKDTRSSGYIFESALQAGIAAAGVDVRLLGPMPTPAIAYLTRTFRAKAGIVISASHNPYTDNGIKFFGADGRKLPDDIELEIEDMLDQPMSMCTADQLGMVRRINDARGRYIEFCKNTVPSSLNLSGLRIVVDAANGAAYHIASDVFEELGADVISIANEPNGVNINRDCGSTHLGQLQARVLETRADLGIAVDGDADRVMLVDHTGAVVDGDQILYLIAMDRLQHGELKGGVVGTLMSNFGLELALADKQVPFFRAGVGDRYVMEALGKHGWMLGGESSGHIVCLDKTSTGDGVVAALQVLLALQRSGNSLQDALQGLAALPQKMINVRGPNRQAFQDSEAVKNHIQDAERQLAGRGRVLLRPSGTEPLIRVMVEGEDAELVETLCSALAETVEQAIA